MRAALSMMLTSNKISRSHIETLTLPDIGGRIFGEEAFVIYIQARNFANYRLTVNAEVASHKKSLLG